VGARVLFMGPGRRQRTELAKALAAFCSAAQDALVRCDLSEFPKSIKSHAMIGSRNLFDKDSQKGDSLPKHGAPKPYQSYAR